MTAHADTSSDTPPDTSSPTAAPLTAANDAAGDAAPTVATVEAGPPAADGLGTELRNARLRRGLSLDALGRELHIQARYLERIEQGAQPGSGRDGELPHVGYVLGYIRAYAEEVGLDGTKAVARYKAEVAAPEALRPRNSPHIVTRRRTRLPRGLVPAVAVLALAVAFAVYYAVQAPPELAPSARGPAVATMDAGAVAGPDTFVLEAQTASWVRIEAGDGSVLFQAIMRPEQRVTVGRDQNPRVDVRDAGAVHLALGARDLGPLGPRGRDVRGIVLGERVSGERAGAATE